MNDWLSYILLGSGLVGLIAIFFMNRIARMKTKNRKTNDLNKLMTEILYFDANDDEFITEANEFSPKQLNMFFGQLFSQYHGRMEYINKLTLLFEKLDLIGENVTEFNQASLDQKMLMLDDFKSLPINEIWQMLLSVMQNQNPDPLILKSAKVLALHKVIEALPIFLKKAVTIPTTYNEEIAEIISGFQADFPDILKDKQDSRLDDFETHIESRFVTFLGKRNQKMMTSGLYVLGYLGLADSTSYILQAIQSAVGRECLHVACTALKKFSHDKFLSDLSMWILTIDDWKSEEIQDLLSVFSRFYPVGESYIEQLTHHSQLLVQVSAKAAIRQSV